MSKQPFSELEGHVDGRILKVWRELSARIDALEVKPKPEAPRRVAEYPSVPPPISTRREDEPKIIDDSGPGEA